MNSPDFGPIDCDIHPTIPGMRVLLPYLDDYWRDHLLSRGTDKLNLSMTSFPPTSPYCGRADWRDAGGSVAASLDAVREQALDAFGSAIAICNPLYAAQILLGEDMAGALCRATNDWIRKEWLDREPRLRASIVIPVESPEQAVAEIERCAQDRRFVQVMVLAMGEMPLGRRRYWPIYEAAERLGLPVSVHAGSSYRHAPTAVGWTSYFLEDYVLQAQAFKTQLLSLIAEGVFVKFPSLTFIMAESGFTWLPGFMWRVDKGWRGLRREVPWLREPPSQTIRERVRFTLQPVDEPPSAGMLERVLEHIGSDEMLLFSTDYPHWQFDGAEALPHDLPQSLVRKITVDNPLATYTRLREVATNEVVT